MNRRAVVSIGLCLFLAGCATARKKDAQLQELQSHVSSLESELEKKEERIKGLEGELASVETKPTMNQGYMETTAPKKAEEPKGTASRMSAKQVQTALKNAGYYKGPIDGKLGRKTRKAIKAFQKAQGLKADGRIGKRTLLRLKKYL